MKRIYLRARIMLLTIALGLASVNFFNWFNDYWNDIPVDLPRFESGSPIFVLPRKFGEYPHIGGGGSGSGVSDCTFVVESSLLKENNLKTKTKNINRNLPNENGRKSN